MKEKNKERLKNYIKIIASLEGYQDPQINITEVEYTIRDDFFKEENGIWEEIKRSPELISFPDKLLAEEMENILSDIIVDEGVKKINVFDPYDDNDIDITFDEGKIKQKIKEIKEDLGTEIAYDEVYDEAIEELIEETLENIDLNEVRVKAQDNLLEKLGYWTIYYIPPSHYVSEDIAIKVGLVPFYYEDEFYLALGGCGLDLSPLLDAYQALTSGTLPSNSRFFRDRKYFESVVGSKIIEEVEKAVKLERPKIYITIE